MFRGQKKRGRCLGQDRPPNQLWLTLCLQIKALKGPRVCSLGRLALQKQTLDLLALWTELSECMGANGPVMSMEKVECIGACKLLHTRGRLGAEP